MRNEPECTAASTLCDINLKYNLSVYVLKFKVMDIMTPILHLKRASRTKVAFNWGNYSNGTLSKCYAPFRKTDHKYKSLEMSVHCLKCSLFKVLSARQNASSILFILIFVLSINLIKYIFQNRLRKTTTSGMTLLAFVCFCPTDHEFTSTVMTV